MYIAKQLSETRMGQKFQNSGEIGYFVKFERTFFHILVGVTDVNLPNKSAHIYFTVINH